MELVADMLAGADYSLLPDRAPTARAVGRASDPDALDVYRQTVARNEARLKKTLSVRDEAREIVWQGLDGDISQATLDGLDQWIGNLDEGIEHNTTSYIETAKFLKRELKSVRAAVDKYKYKDLEELFNRGQSVWFQEIAETIDFATFLRAVRAAKSKSELSGPTFEKPTDLTRFLEGAIGEQE